MIPPSFSDLGKAAKDLFDKKFKFGLLGVDCTSTKDPITLKIEGTHDMKSKVLTGSFESKHSAAYGVDVTTKWTTKNILSTEITKNPTWIHGLKSTALVTLEPDTGKKSLKIKENFKRDLLNFNSELIFTSAKPLINMNIVLGCTETRGYLGGADVQVDSHAQAINRYVFALGYQKHDFSIVVSVQNCSLFNALVHQRVSDHSDIGINVAYNKQTQELKYGLVGQYKIPNAEHSFIKAKIDQNSKVGLVYGTTVRDGVQLSICGEIDVRNFETGPHNVGVGISYEP